MRLLAGLGAGVLVYLLIGRVVGISPHLWRRPGRGRRLGVGWKQRLLGADLLVGSGVRIRPSQLVIVSLIGAVAAGVVVNSVSGVAPLAVVAGVLAIGAPRAALKRRRSLATRERLAAWPDALRDVVTHLRASMSIHDALSELGRSGPSPLRPAFVRYGSLSVALDYRSALDVVRQELADPLSDRVIEILLIAFDHGSAVVIDILDDLAESSAQDLRLIDEIDTAQLETKLEARGASILPLVVLGLLCATSAGYRDFYSSPAGWLVLTVGGVMALVGLGVISRLGRVATESRILTGTPL